MCTISGTLSIACQITADTLLDDVVSVTFEVISNLNRNKHGIARQETIHNTNLCFFALQQNLLLLAPEIQHIASN